MESQHQPTQSDEPAAAPLPMPAAFSKLSESIAAQEALLQTIKQERSKFHARQQAQTLEKECADNGRFEVIADTPPSRS
uniref:Uncharacterized protein n=1 Tax=Globisporangium ultimum (strain ATCC 200006 / CBS 805.95 / DAOM BR144) TaxID=431595 RepID=K3WAG7_GLOUD